jgi:predicted DNA-binding transcriptional regulator AlpA
MYLDTIPNDFEAMKGHKRVFELAGRHAKEGLETLSWMMRATKDWDMSQEQVGECGYMDIRAVANYLGVSIPAIKAWRRKGQFAEPHMFGRRVRWNPEDVKE